MHRSLLVIFIAFVMLAMNVVVVFAQSKDWSRYALADKDVSLLFPGMPLKVKDRSQLCNGLKIDNYGIFSDGAVYVLSVAYKISPPENCEKRREFSEENFNNRLDAFKYDKKLTVDAGLKKTKLIPLKFKASNGLYELFNDPKNHRWFELAVYGADESKPEAIAFFNSLVVDEKLEGVEIGEGRIGRANIAPAAATPLPSPTTVATPSATPLTATSEVKKVTSSSGVGGGIGNGVGSGIGSGIGPGGIGSGSGSTGGTETSAVPMTGVRLILRATPPYTEEARKNQIAGTVMLRVTFNANGTIGAITPIRGLGYGLTEQAIWAARKIVFIPAHRNGTYITVWKAVQYNFSLY